MREHLVFVCGWAMLAYCETSVAFGQTQATSVDIPLTYFFDSQSNAARLSIKIGINGGAPRPYLFDTGSSLFNAAFDPKTWGGYSDHTSVPTSTVANGNDVKLCYSESGGCRGYVGNILQIPLLNFYEGSATTTDTAPVATLSTPSGPVKAFRSMPLTSIRTPIRPPTTSSPTTFVMPRRRIFRHRRVCSTACSGPASPSISSPRASAQAPPIATLRQS